MIISPPLHPFLFPLPRQGFIEGISEILYHSYHCGICSHVPHVRDFLMAYILPLLDLLRTGRRYQARHAYAALVSE